MGLLRTTTKNLEKIKPASYLNVISGYEVALNEARRQYKAGQLDKVSFQATARELSLSIALAKALYARNPL